VSILLLSGVLVAGIVVLTPVADRARVPLPVALTVFGLLVPLVPSTPDIRIDPDLILPTVLPPLLFAATQRSSAHEFRDNARPILVLAVGLTLATAAVVAWVAHQAGLAWGPAWVLGAVVAPPDPVAATAVARRLRLPARLTTILEGEGMFNDATALVLYNVAVLAVVSGHLSTGEVAGAFLLAVLVGTGIGLLAAVLVRAALGALHDAAAETTVTVAAPFAVYLLAEHLEGSGVLAVLSLGLFLRSYGHPALTSGGWLLGRAVWSFADYLITSLVFVLIGFELTVVLEEVSIGHDEALLAGGVVLTLVVVRFGWLFPAAALGRAWSRRRDAAMPYGARETTVVAWAGMRGVVTVAAALALPRSTDEASDFPDRAEIALVALSCVLLTLVLQGLTLSPLVRRLGVSADDEDLPGEVTTLRRRAAEAALDAVRRACDDLPDVAVRAAEQQYEGYLAAQGTLEQARSHGGADDQDSDPRSTSRGVAEALRRASEAERDLVLDARRRGQVSPAAADEVLQDIESRAVRDIE